MNPETTIEIGGKAYPITFSTNAAFQLGVYLRQNQMGTTQEFLDRLINPNAGVIEVQLFLWACLEGGRRRTHSRPRPFTVDEAGDLIDQAGGLMIIAKQLVAAIQAAAPSSSNGASGRKPRQTKKKKPTGGTGRSSSAKPQKSESAQTSSGT